MNVRTIAATLACLMVAGCASSSSGQLPGVSVSGPTVVRPNALNKVDIHIANESTLHIEFQTGWSYPAHPFWTNAHHRCVDPAGLWQTYIDYNYASPQAEVVAYERNGGCSQKAGELIGHEFKDIHLKNGRGLLQVKVRDKHDFFEMCWKQSDETSYTCQDSHPFLRRTFTPIAASAPVAAPMPAM
jgi:hypothetical protein